MTAVDNRNKVKLKITGSEFVISAEESTQYIQKIVKMVDTRINNLYEQDSKLSIPMATILAAIKYCDELEKERRITNELLDKAEFCQAAAKKAMADLEKYSVENEQLKEEKAGLHKIIEELREKTGTMPESQQQGSLINEKNTSQVNEEQFLSRDIPVTGTASTDHKEYIDAQPVNEPEHIVEAEPVVEVISEPEEKAPADEKQPETAPLRETARTRSGGFVPRSMPIAHTTRLQNNVPPKHPVMPKINEDKLSELFTKEDYSAASAVEEEMMSFFNQRNS